MCDMFAVKVNREEGFHIDLEDYLMGLLQLASELVGVFKLTHCMMGNLPAFCQLLIFFLKINPFKKSF